MAARELGPIFDKLRITLIKVLLSRCSARLNPPRKCLQTSCFRSCRLVAHVRVELSLSTADVVPCEWQNATAVNGTPGGLPSIFENCGFHRFESLTRSPCSSRLQTLQVLHQKGPDGVIVPREDASIRLAALVPSNAPCSDGCRSPRHSPDFPSFSLSRQSNCQSVSRSSGLSVASHRECDDGCVVASIRPSASCHPPTTRYDAVRLQ